MPTSRPTSCPACRGRARLPPKHFYDAAGSDLFEAITDLAEYYPTRTEIVLRQAASEIVGHIPDGAALVDPAAAPA